MPISKGLSWYESKKLMIDAIGRRDKDGLAEIWRASLENNLDAKKIYQSAKSEANLEQEMSWDDTEKLLTEIRNMGREKGMEKFNKMKESGKITPTTEKRIKSILEQEKRVKLQKEKLNIK